MRSFWGLFSVTGLLLGGSVATAQYDRDETRAAMQRVLAALRETLPVAVSEQGFANPERRERVHVALQQLAEEASSLDDHAKDFDAGSFWFPQADFYLELAVRTAPQSMFGRDAFAVLEEETLMGYTGSGELHLPDEERRRLDALRALVSAPASPLAPAR